MLSIGYARSDGRVGGSWQQEMAKVIFNDPHPGSLSLADPPRKGEEKESVKATEYD
ncbi:MAG: hypothetical protein WA650_16450 [Bradyrhizobium sp.]